MARPVLNLARSPTSCAWGGGADPTVYTFIVRGNRLSILMKAENGHDEAAIDAAGKVDALIRLVAGRGGAALSGGYLRGDVKTRTLSLTTVVAPCVFDFVDVIPGRAG